MEILNILKAHARYPFRFHVEQHARFRRQNMSPATSKNMSVRLDDEHHAALEKLSNDSYLTKDEIARVAVSKLLTDLKYLHAVGK